MGFSDHRRSPPVTTRRRHRLAAVSLAALLTGTVLFPGCATAPKRPAIAFTGDPIVDGNALRAAAAPKDRSMWDYRVAAVALRKGNLAEAKTRLDAAILAMGGILANTADAKRARSLFRSEANKTFVGEPYERAMVYYYRGILYWIDGEPDNARACFRSAQFVDSDAETESYRNDYVLLEYLDGFATEKVAGDGADALARARTLAKSPLTDYDRQANVLLFAEWGRGPTKFAGGEHGQQLRFRPGKSQAVSARLVLADQTLPLPAYDDLTYQATTRGGRTMDEILGNKARFKEGADTAGNVALVGALATAQHGRGEDADKAALALAAVGLFSKLAAAATATQADVRQWDNLPNYLSFAALRLPPGEHSGTLEFLDAAGAPVPAMTKPVTITVGDPSADTVVFLSNTPATLSSFSP